MLPEHRVELEQLVHQVMDQGRKEFPELEEPQATSNTAVSLPKESISETSNRNPGYNTCCGLQNSNLNDIGNIWSPGLGCNLIFPLKKMGKI